MYVGRIVAIGRSPRGRNAAMYRVSSRSFPNREAKINDGMASIMPRPGHEGDLSKNPYIAYNCIRIAGDWAIASNGSHTDPIAEKVGLGMPVRDAMLMALAVMDYEKDDYDTPRIASAVHRIQNKGYLGVVRKDAVHVCGFQLDPGRLFYVATYTHNTPSKGYSDDMYTPESAETACEYILSQGVFANLQNPVTSAAVFAGSDGFEMAAANA